MSSRYFAHYIEDSGPRFTADAVLLATVSSAFAADAAISFSVTDSFTANAIVRKSTLATLTADSVIFKNSGTKTFTANAVILKTQSFTRTADADLIVGSRVLATFTANAVIKKTISGTKTANSVIKKTDISFTKTADALLIEPGAHVFGASALIVAKIFEDNFNRTATVLGQPSGPGSYAAVQFDNTVILDGSDLTVDPEEWDIFTYPSPSTQSGYVQFDFFTVPDSDTNFEDQFIYSQQAVTHYVGGVWIPYFDISKEWGEPWVVETFEFFEPLALDDSTWYRIRHVFDPIEQVEGVKVWKVSDPEPDTFVAFGTLSSGTFSPFYDTSAYFELLNEHADDWAQLTRIDNLVVYTSKPGLNGAFSADAVLSVPSPDLNPFYANAYLVKRTESDFDADAWIRGTSYYSFTANAVLFRQPTEDADRIGRLRKTTTIHVAVRRPIALGAYVPPKSPEPDPDEPTGLTDVPCLPPCPGYPAGPGSLYGGNGAAIRRSIIYCDSCGVFYNTTSNKMGIGTGTTSGHPGCEASHNRNLHELRVFADYAALPITDVGMISKLVWSGNAPTTAGIKVFANIPELPPLVENEDFVAWSQAFDNDYWSNGDYLGTMMFTATDSTTTASGVELQWTDNVTSLTIRPEGLYTDIFKFEIFDLTQYYGAEFRAPNVPVLVGS